VYEQQPPASDLVHSVRIARPASAWAGWQDLLS
jgi:hypothetical protein